MRRVLPIFLLWILFSFFLVVSPMPIYAQTCQQNESLTDLGCIPNDPAGFVGKFYGIGLGLIGGVSVLFIIYGGYIILTSQGNPLQLANGKSYIMYAIIGVLLAIFGYAIVEILLINILHVPGFS